MADIPERYAPATTCYNRFVRRRKIGVWDRLFAAVSKAYDGNIQMVDSTTIRVHQHDASGRKGGLFAALAEVGNRPDPRCMGRSRGGLTTKIHAVVDAEGLPIVLTQTPGQAHDGASTRSLLGSVGAG